MSNQSPRPPLSLTSGSNGSSSNIQDDVSPPYHSAQSSNPALLDGIGPHHSDQPIEPIRLTFSDALKFRLGSYGSGSQPTVESKLGHQPRTDESTRVILVGVLSPEPPTPPV